MIGRRNLAPDRGPNVWTRTAGAERDEQARLAPVGERGADGVERAGGGEEFGAARGRGGGGHRGAGGQKRILPARAGGAGGGILRR